MYRYLPPATQVVLISATLPHEILEMTNKFMTDPIRILVKRSVDQVSGRNVELRLFRVKPDPTLRSPRLSLSLCVNVSRPQ